MFTFSFDGAKAGTTSYLVYGPLILLFERENDTPPIGTQINSLTKAGIELLNLISIQPDLDYMMFVAKQFNSGGIRAAWAPFLGVEEGTGETHLASIINR